MYTSTNTIQLTQNSQAHETILQKATEHCQKPLLCFSPYPFPSVTPVLTPNSFSITPTVTATLRKAVNLVHMLASTPTVPPQGLTNPRLKTFEKKITSAPRMDEFFLLTTNQRQNWGEVWLVWQSTYLPNKRP
jgi:hypothetical protein